MEEAEEEVAEEVVEEVVEIAEGDGGERRRLSRNKLRRWLKSKKELKLEEYKAAKIQDEKERI